MRVHSEELLSPVEIVGLGKASGYCRDIKSLFLHCLFQQEELVSHYLVWFAGYPSCTQVAEGYRQEGGSHVECLSVSGAMPPRYSCTLGDEAISPMPKIRTPSTIIQGLRFANIIPSPKARIKIPVMMLFRGLNLSRYDEIQSAGREL
jgi:hypothetical protein